MKLHAVAGAHWLPALLWQFCAIAVGRAFSAHAMLELDSATSQSALVGGWSWPGYLASFGALLLFAVAANCLLAATILVAAAISGGRISWREALTIAAYTIVPFALGDALSRVAFGMILPLSHDISGVWAAHLRPFSLGAVTFAPQLFPPLSLSWFFCAFCDLFSLWSTYLVWTGLRQFARFNRIRAGWALMGLVLLLALAIAAAWQASQFAILRTAQ